MESVCLVVPSCAEILKPCKTVVLQAAGTLCVFVLALLSLSFVSPQKVLAAQANLSWNASTSSGVTGYKLYYGMASGGYSQSVDVGNATSYTVASLENGKTYYFAAKAYNSTGNQSGYSSEVSYIVPALPTPTLYTISASAGSGGSISPAGSVAVSKGLSQSYSIVPNTGYRIAGLTVDGVSVGAVSTYTFSNIAASHTIQASFTASTSLPVGTVVFADNAGGSLYKDSAGLTYAADSKYSGGSIGSTTNAIGGTVDDTLYKTERYGNFTYSIPVANGNYNVTLKFAEFYFSATGKRVFSVKINGRTVISSLDLYAKVGKNNAYDVVVPVSVSNGALSMQFISQVNNAKVSGILVKTR